MRWRAATLLLSVAVAILVVAFSRDVSVPSAPADGLVRAGLPFVEADPGGAVLVCVSSRAGSILPPFLGQPYTPATIAPLVPLAASNASPPPPNSSYHILRQYGAAVQRSRPVRSSSFGVHIPHVIQLRTEEEMRRVATRGVVAVGAIV